MVIDDRSATRILVLRGLDFKWFDGHCKSSRSQENEETVRTDPSIMRTLVVHSKMYPPASHLRAAPVCQSRQKEVTEPK